ncbi:MAG: hypothetical protein ABTS22_19260 [Accumulibacter sp.]|uniref:hypothetical protein n=1 Tax=Accumulibacter sp. TaxID=2053492 RepID=UPI00331525CC
MELSTLESHLWESANLSIPLYVKRITVNAANDKTTGSMSSRAAWDRWETYGRAFSQQMDALVETLDSLHASGAPDA